MPLDAVQKLVDIMRRLRSEDGCPWDREQTLDTLKPYLVEECYEVLDAIDDGDPARHCDELGDLLLHVVFQAQIRAETDDFALEDVAAAICDKLIRRHPHVFGDTDVANADEVVTNWNEIKAREKSDAGCPAASSALGEWPRGLPAMSKGQKLQERASRVGFDWQQIDDVAAKVNEELGEVREALASGDRDAIRAEVGDLLFAAINLSRFAGIDAEDALNGSTRRFVRRFKAMERRLEEEGKTLGDTSPTELNGHWNAVKADEA